MAESQKSDEPYKLELNDLDQKIKNLLIKLMFFTIAKVHLLFPPESFKVSKDALATAT